MSNYIQDYLNANQVQNISQIKPSVVPTQQVVNPIVQNKNITELPNTTLGKDIINNTNSIKKLDEVFKKLEGKNEKEFADCAYNEFVKLMGLEGVAPKSITWEKNEGRPIVGDYRFWDNSVVFYTDYFFKNDKATQLGIIAHELTHCKQLVNMLTTEGISVEKIASAYAVSDLRSMLTRNPKVIAMHNEAKKKGKEKEFIQMMIQAGTVKTTNELKQAYAHVLKLPKHPLNSPEGLKAQKDLVAQYNYNGSDMTAYNACPLEKEAYAVENMVKAAYKTRLQK